MHRFVKHGVLYAATVVMCAVYFVVSASPGLAIPAVPAPGSSTSVDAVKAQESAARTELDQRRADLSAKVAEYMALGRQLERTRAEVSEVATQIAEGDIAMIRARGALASRAVQLYRSDRSGLIEILFDSRSLQDFFVRARYLSIITQRDARLLSDYRLSQTENMWLQQSLADKEAQLVKLQAQADVQSKRIESDIAAAQARSTALGADVARLMVESATPVSAVGGASSPSVGGKPSSQYQPDTVVSEANFRASGSMTAADIQAFLDRQSGTLGKYRGPDHAGVVKSAAEMIAEASVKWGISPKVMLATLQKEQSLITRKTVTQESMDWAMGCGKADSFTSYQYQGFGKQIWFGAYKFKQNADLWKPGATQKIDGSTVRPTNPGTHAQYRYTPHFPGVMSFWMIYWRYFGDPLS